ncbi:AAC(3) family N-acetyltransferase [Actinoplanes sp. NPDC049118]|uniref:AAC(3) family N-acetyltransferase n=1 Tax=Actinoplanes sp. NPDC049118 TaxID=3155769 RepID=UPI0033E40631
MAAGWAARAADLLRRFPPRPVRPRPAPAAARRRRPRRLNGKVLLLGCGHGANTSLHLAERRQPAAPRTTTSSSIRQADGAGRWGHLG